MKIKSYLGILSILLLFSCKKDIQQDRTASTRNLSNYATDGLLSVQVSISGNSTPSTFLANSPGGSVSYTGYDLVAGTKKIYTDYFHMAAPYPIVSAMFEHPNGDNQPYPFQVLSAIFPNKSVNIATSILYNNVDSSTSPSVVTCILKDIIYHTEDYTSHTLKVDKTSGSSFSMCLVNNIAHMSFQSPPKYEVRSNGYVEMAELKLTGDTNWTLKSLPINFYFPDGSYGAYPSRILVQNNGVKIATAIVKSGHGATIDFGNGFKHIAGNTEVLKIYGYQLNISLPGFFVTEMGDLNGLNWYDGLNGFISGSLNQKYYKEETNGATLYNH